VEATAENQQPAWHRYRLLGWSLAGAVLLTVALWACIAVLPGRLYPPLTNQDLAGLTAAQRAQRIEGRYKLQNDARTTLLQGLAALLVLAGAGLGATVTLRQMRISRKGLEDARKRQRAKRSRLVISWRWPASSCTKPNARPAISSHSPNRDRSPSDSLARSTSLVVRIWRCDWVGFPLWGGSPAIPRTTVQRSLRSSLPTSVDGPLGLRLNRASIAPTYRSTDNQSSGRVHPMCRPS
jgi:hypothetical protein